MCNYLFILATIFFFCGKQLTNILGINQVSLFQIGTPRYQTSSSAKLLFPGKGNKDDKTFLLEFGISEDLRTPKLCSNTKMKSLFEELKSNLIHYFSVKGLLMGLKRKSSLIEQENQVENCDQMYQEINATLIKLLNQIFECILIKKASNKKGYRVSQNHFNCTIYSFVYYLSMASLSKKIVKLLEEILSDFTKSKCKCQIIHADSKETPCIDLLYSVKTIKSSMITETSHHHSYRRTVKECKPYVYHHLFNLFK